MSDLTHDLTHEMKWGAAYETGLPAIDCQHQSLFKALKCLHEATGDANIQAEARVVLEFLEKYTRVHFTDEETLMQRVAFPGLDAHRSEHRHFQLRLHDLRLRGGDDRAALSQETSLLLFQWFRDHILIQDKAFAAFIHQAEVPVP